MSAPPFPARLHVLLARNAPVGLVIRRGPSKSTAFVGWNRTDDTFRVGQWLRGRVYERRCDISPDGRHLIYFAMNGRPNTATGGSWTALSRTPYLKALTLYGKGDCWNGGGLFRDDHSYWLNDGPFPHIRLQDDAPLTRVDHMPAVLGECPPVYYERLVRDGWTLGETIGAESHTRVVLIDKTVSPRWTLRKRAHATVNAGPGRGCYFDTHELIDRAGRALPREDWEWADVADRRLVYASSGRLFAAPLAADGEIGEGRLLQDFNAMKFQNLRAPY